ncbi:hypothetical protein CIE15_000251 [Salmonella enterica subsp. enterica serovar Oranienburg]|nr:hypothetical protein [Salmonella enterica subsp. enterica serovar Oranienburg]
MAGLPLRCMVNLTTRCPNGYRWRKKPAILTAAPFRGLPQPEAHYRSGFNDSHYEVEVLRSALSCCVLACTPVTFSLFNLNPLFYPCYIL